MKPHVVDSTFKPISSYIRGEAGVSHHALGFCSRPWPRQVIVQDQVGQESNRHVLCGDHQWSETSPKVDLATSCQLEKGWCWLQNLFPRRNNSTQKASQRLFVLDYITVCTHSCYCVKPELNNKDSPRQVNRHLGQVNLTTQRIRGLQPLKKAD